MNVYDLVYSHYREDIPFYLEWAKRTQPGAVLELFCGTGRVTLPIAELGISITGLDRSGALLSSAKRKSDERGLSVLWEKQDAREFSVDRSFGLVIAPFNSIQHITETEDLRRLLTQVRRHLDPGGTFIFDMIDLAHFIPMRHEKSRGLINRYVDPGTNEEIRVEAAAEYDESMQVWENRLTYSSDSRPDFFSETILVRSYYPQEMRMILESEGFKVESLSGTWSGDPLKKGDGQMVFVCSASG